MVLVPVPFRQFCFSCYSLFYCHLRLFGCSLWSGNGRTRAGECRSSGFLRILCGKFVDKTYQNSVFMVIKTFYYSTNTSWTKKFNFLIFLNAFFNTDKRVESTVPANLSHSKKQTCLCKCHKTHNWVLIIDLFIIGFYI